MSFFQEKQIVKNFCKKKFKKELRKKFCKKIFFCKNSKKNKNCVQRKRFLAEREKKNRQVPCQADRKNIIFATPYKKQAHKTQFGSGLRYSVVQQEVHQLASFQLLGPRSNQLLHLLVRYFHWSRSAPWRSGYSKILSGLGYCEFSNIGIKNKTQNSFWPPMDGGGATFYADEYRSRILIFLLCKRGARG